MTNRKKIQHKCKLENLIIDHLYYFVNRNKRNQIVGGDWILWVDKPIFTKNTSKIDTHGEGILRTTIIPSNKVDEFCNSNLSEYSDKP